jgi:hypothetical protein
MEAPASSIDKCSTYMYKIQIYQLGGARHGDLTDD